MPQLLFTKVPELLFTHRFQNASTFVYSGARTFAYTLYCFTSTDGDMLMYWNNGRPFLENDFFFQGCTMDVLPHPYPG